MIGAYLLPVIVLIILSIALIKKLPAIDLFVDGVNEAIGLIYKLFPRLLALIFSVKLLTESDIYDGLIRGFQLFKYIPIPTELWSLILLKPLSGSAALALTKEIFTQHGPDSTIGLMASVIQGATDTTLYIITVYFGAVGIKRVKTALKIGLMADFIGIMTAVLIAKWFFYMK